MFFSDCQLLNIALYSRIDNFYGTIMNVHLIEIQENVIKIHDTVNKNFKTHSNGEYA